MSHLSPYLHSLESHKRALVQACRSRFCNHLGFYSAYGENYPVPRQKHIPVDFSADPQCWKLLRIYFGIHGTVQVYKNASRIIVQPVLRLTKTAQHSEILHLFLETLGGSVLKHSPKFDLLSQSHCFWTVRGKSVVPVSRALSSLRSPLQPKILHFAQLEDWPSEYAERCSVEAAVGATHWDPTQSIVIETINDAAVFFDVSGSLHLQGPNFNRVLLLFSCPSVVEHTQLTELFRRELGSSVTPSIWRRPAGSRSPRGTSLWTLKHDGHVKDILELLEGDLLLRRSEASLGLRMYSASKAEALTEWYQLKKVDISGVARLQPRYQDLGRRLHNANNMLSRNPWRSDLKEEKEELKSEIRCCRLQAQIEYLESLLDDFEKGGCNARPRGLSV